MEPKITDDLQKILCGLCGIEFAIPNKLDEAKRGNGSHFYCPNGHEMYYKGSMQFKLAEMTKERDHWMAEAQRLLGELDNMRNKTGDGKGFLAKLHLKP